MADNQNSSALSWLIPLLGGAAAAYSPRYLGTGVNTFAQMYGANQALKQRQQRAKRIARLRSP